jgi:RND superfamily putative drug exporter
MRRGLIVTGGVITSAGVVLAGTFFVMAAMPMTVLTELGFAIAIGVLFDALVVRTLLVPALGFMLGEKMWWPAHFDHVDRGAPSLPKDVPPQILAPVAPATPPETPLPDWTRIGGSARYR